MYIDYFKLKEPPFSLTPDPRYLFMSERHREGLAHLLYGVEQPGGFVQLTGEIGSGKTTLCRCLIRQLPADTDVALVLNPRLTAIELLATVCDELRIPYPPHTNSIKVLIDVLNQRLLETHALRRHTVLIIDEAQNLHGDVLEQIRLLTNLETSQEKLLQIILIGQPELLTLLKGKRLKQLAQRITARYHLDPLSRSETYAYIQHRMLIAGRRDPLFTRNAMRCVYRLSGGVPRIINIICDRALLGAYARDERRIKAAIVRKASRETSGRARSYRRIRLAWTTGIAVLMILLLGGAIYLSPKTRSILQRNRATAWLAKASPAESGSVSANPVAGQSAAGHDHPISTSRQSGGGNLNVSRNVPPTATEAGSGLAARNPARASLADVLASSPNSDASSFASLYAMWGAKIPPNTKDLGCKAAAAEGFECLFQVGNWPKLRRFDLPAVLELLLPGGTRRRVALVGLGAETADLAIEGRRYEFPILEIDRVWDGSFILLWKPPFAARKFSYGSRGEQVKWVRKALDRLEGKPPGMAVSDIYDEELRQRIVAFQQGKSLMPDGFVGSETLVRLVLALEGPRGLALSNRAR